MYQSNTNSNQPSLSHTDIELFLFLSRPSLKLGLFIPMCSWIRSCEKAQINQAAARLFAPTFRTLWSSQSLILRHRMHTFPPRHARDSESVC